MKLLDIFKPKIKFNKTVVIIRDDEHLFGFANTEEEAVEWVKRNWNYDDEKIEYEKKQSGLSFVVVARIN
jgi:hypothetical protein